MRYAPCLVLLLVACGRPNSDRGARSADTAATVDTAAARAPDAAMLAPKLVGTWAALGYDSASTSGSKFTIVWRQEAGGQLRGTITPSSGPKYEVRVVSATDSSFVQESEPHLSPTLKAEVVTRTEAQLAGDSLVGTYEARTTDGARSLSGRFSATRGR